MDRQLADMAHDYARLADGKITGLEAIRTVRLLWQLSTSTGYIASAADWQRTRRGWQLRTKSEWERVLVILEIKILKKLQ